MQGPVLVTHHGRPRLVVLSAEEFERLAEAGGEPDPVADEVHEAGRDNFIANMFEGFVAFDADLRVRDLNNVAIASMGHGLRELVGKAVDSPEYGEQGELLAALLRRVLRTGEVVQFENRGFFHPHRYFEARAFPFRGGVGVTFSHLTELLDLRREAEVCRSRGQAVAALGLVSLLDVNAMGFVVEVNEVFCELVGLPAAQLLGARLIDFVAPQHRDEVAQSMNAVMQGRSSQLGDAIELIGREQAAVAVRLSAVRQTQKDVCIGLAIACIPI